MESLISSISGSLITWSDSAIYNNITTPIYTWLGSFVNVVISFWPVFVVVALFGLVIGIFIGFFGKSKQKNNKSLYNK